MPIIPKKADLLDDLINASQRISNVERGCGTGPDTADTPDPLDPDAGGDPDADPNDPNSGGDDGTPDPTVAQDMTIDIIPRGIGTIRKSGVQAYTEGLYPLYGVKKKNYLKGFAVNPNTYVATSVEIQARVKTRVVKKVADGAWSTLFHLPPGWWPTSEVTASALTALGGVRVSGTGHPTVPIRVTTEGHVQAQGPFHHPQTGSGGPGHSVQALDLRGIKFTAGGGSCPGIPTDDPTSAGDGRAWDFCQSEDGDLDPPQDPGAGGGGGGAFTLTDLGLSNPDSSLITYVAAAASSYGRATDPIGGNDVGVGFIAFNLQGNTPASLGDADVLDSSGPRVVMQSDSAPDGPGSTYALLAVIAGSNVQPFNGLAAIPIIGVIQGGGHRVVASGYVTAGVGSDGTQGTSDDTLVMVLTFDYPVDPTGKFFTVAGYFNAAWLGPGGS